MCTLSSQPCRDWERERKRETRERERNTREIRETRLERVD